MRRIFLTLITFLSLQSFCFAQEADSFNLNGIIEGFINSQSKPDVELNSKNTKSIYLFAEENMENGNVVVSYSEYLKAIESTDNNVALLMLAKRLYEKGFFTLGDIALAKITDKKGMSLQIETLKETYKPLLSLTKEEETYLAKAYTSIYYNSSPEEVAFNLIKKTSLMENSDYANYMMAQAMFECEQYNQALIYIDKAILKNEINSRYKLFKAKTLFEMKRYKEALKFVELNEHNISVFLKNDFLVLKQNILSNLTSNDNDKKFYSSYPIYLSGDYYKTVSETKNILNFTKNNYKVMTLKGMAHLVLGEEENAKEEFEASYKLNKKFPQTVMGLGDIEFREENFNEAYRYYKKLFNTELKNEAILKASICLEKMGNQPKKLAKLEKMKTAFDDKSYYEYYLISNSLFTDEANKKKYAIESLRTNFLNQNTWNIFYELDYKDKDFYSIDRISFILLFSGKYDAQYYYYNALSEDYKNNKKEAFYLAKKSLEVNPAFKPALELLNRLQGELI